MEQADRAWVEEVTGGRVVEARRTVTGGSRATWLVDVEDPSGGQLDLVLRRDSGDGPFSGTAFSLAREATVYRALAGSAVSVPEVLAVAPDGLAFLARRVEGSDDFDSISDAETRAGVVDSLVRQIAALHTLDPADLELPGFDHPVTPEDHALLDLDAWERILDDKVRRPLPLARFALRYARRHAPVEVDRTVLCWGDVGPGNFLHEEGSVSALLDWELAHLGDPMDDLVFLALRANLLFAGRLGETSDVLRRYGECSGTELDAKRLDYYRAVVLARWLIAATAALDGRDRAQMSGSTYVVLGVMVSKWLSVVLAQQVGLATEATPIPDGADPSVRREVVEVLQSELQQGLFPAISDPAAFRRGLGMAVMLDHLRCADTLAGAVEAAELDDLASLLGHRPGSLGEGLVALDAAVAAAEPERDDELVRFFVRQSDRQGALWPALAPYLAKPVETFTP